MASIIDKIAQIRQAVFGKDVRESIASGIEDINTEVESTTAKQNLLETEFDQLIINEGNSNAEIVQARVDASGKTYVNLQQRMNSVDSSLAEKSQQISALDTNKADKTEVNSLATEKADKTQVNALDIKKADQAFVDAQFATIVSGSPKETFIYLAALQTKYPNGTDGVMLVLEDGYWYYWNSTTLEWTSGGVYQEKKIADKSVTFKHIKTIQIGNLNSDLQKDFKKQFYQLDVEFGGINLDGSFLEGINRIRTKDFIDVSAGDEIINRPVLSGNTKFLYNIGFYDGNNKIIGWSDYMSDNYIFADNARIKIVFKTSAGTDMSVNAPVNVMQGAYLNKLSKYDKYVSKHKNNIARCIVNNAKINIGTGTISLIYDEAYYCIALVEIEGNAKYKANKFRTIYLYDANYQYISNIPIANIIDNTITTPINAKYMSYSLLKTDIITTDDIYCAKESDYVQGTYIKDLYIEKSLEELGANFIYQKADERGANLYLTKKYIFGSYYKAGQLTYNDSVVNNDEPYVVAEGDKVYASVFGFTIGGITGIRLSCWNNGVFVKDILPEEVANKEYITIPAGINELYIPIWVELAEYDRDVRIWNTSTTPQVQITANEKIKEIDEKVGKIEGSPLKGLNLSIMGDSRSSYPGWVPDGYRYYYNGSNAGVSSVDQMWWKRLADNNDMNILKIESYSGSKVSNNKLNDPDYVFVPFSDLSRCNNLHAAEADPDIIVIMGGTNDFSKDFAKLGTWNGHEAISTDDSNFRGAYALMLHRIQTRYPFARVFCCSIPTFVRTKSDTGQWLEYNDEGKTVVEYNNAIKEIAELFNCGYVDLTQCGINRQNIYPTYCTEENTAEIGRWTHCNSAGHYMEYKQIERDILKVLK
ncbi:GDSL-type esterase/lipase family protein [Clostridium peptidivorans]|uniref:GDSL-type esterase/lipase family protein n=1 Tax=Clostridium peptidivorans TaxID=100174 RepID=UPI000BE2C56D|nr:GDSL-type esterase/lipase family protein [Clostridium peptidivorans]